MKRKGAINNKILAMTVSIIVALTITGLAYSHWQERITIIGTITTGRWGQSIGSSKVVTPKGYDENRSIKERIINDGQTLMLICANISSGWHIWAGILIQNEGTTPTSVEQPIIEVIGANIQDFTINIYYYGPYDRGNFKEVWGGVKMEDLPFKNWKEAGKIILEPNQKAVIWIEFSYENSAVIGETTIYITIQYNIS